MSLRKPGQGWLQLGLALFVLGCTDTRSATVSNMDRPGTAVMVCSSDGTVQALSECKDGTGFELFVLQRHRSTLAILNLNDLTWEDQDPSIPGITGLAIPGQALDVIRAPSGLRLFVLSHPGTVSRVEVSDRSTTTSEISRPARAMQAHQIGESAWLYFLADDGTSLWRWKLDAQDTPEGVEEEAEVLPEEFSDFDVHPVDHRIIGVSRDGTRLWSKVPGADSWTVVSLQAHCSDGLDNDEDGLIDGLDPNCVGPNDTTETPGETEFACSNGLDDDEDGVTDLEDPGCVRSDDNSEGSDQAACSDGIDNDGDGSIDNADGSCLANRLHFETPTCSDGVDNDGDGVADGDDPDCVDGGQEIPHAPPCSNQIDDNGDSVFDDPSDPICDDAASTAEALPQCMDGVDNDLDGLTDTEDSSCYGPLGTEQSQAAQSGFSRVIAHPTVLVAYVLRSTQRELLPVDLDAGVVLRSKTEHPVWDKKQIPESPLSGMPLDMVFTQIPTTDDDGNEIEPRWEALVATESGAVYRFDPVNHRFFGPEVAEDDEFGRVTRVSSPSLTVAGEVIDIRFTLPRDVAHFGSLTIVDTVLTVEGEEKNLEQFYGITPFADDSFIPSETWTVTSGAVLPGTERGTGTIRIINSAFEDPGARFCDAGVEAGDWLEIRPSASISCGSLQGEIFRVEINELNQDALQIGGASLQMATSDEDGVLQWKSVGDLACENAAADFVHFESDSDANPAVCEGLNWDCAPNQLRFSDACGCGCVDGGLSPQCLSGPINYSVRIANDVFLVEGSRSGVIHPWIAGPTGCALGTEDPTWTARAHAGTLAEGTEVEQCPLTLEVPELELITFRNPFFEFSLVPGCSATIEGLRISTPVEDARYAFTISGGDQAQIVLIGSGGSALDAPSIGGPVVFIDDVTEAVYLIDPDTRSVTGQVY